MFKESEKQYLQHKEVSSERKEEAIKYAQELNSLRAKESPTEGDKKRAEELAERIKWIYSPEKRLELESEKAKKLLQDLKLTNLYDEKKKQWNWWMSKKGELKSSYRYSEPQLLGVLAEAVTGNLEGAKELLQDLKDNTVLYDEKKKQWNWWMSKKGELRDSSRYSNAQLLGVLAEALSDKGEELVWFLTH